MKDFNPVLERMHPNDDTRVHTATLVPDVGLGSQGWLVMYELAVDKVWINDMHLMHVVAGVVQWAHPIDYDETRPQPIDEVLGAADNVGTRRTAYLIRWDKTQSTWHTDTKEGRYSVRRVHKRGPFGAFLNNIHIAVGTSHDVQAVKRAVELRICEVRRIRARGVGALIGE